MSYNKANFSIVKNYFQQLCGQPVAKGLFPGVILSPWKQFLQSPQHQPHVLCIS
jgi:hypothetical protein